MTAATSKISSLWPISNRFPIAVRRSHPKCRSQPHPPPLHAAPIEPNRTVAPIASQPYPPTAPHRFAHADGLAYHLTIKYIRDKRSPVPLSETTSRVMSANRDRDTKPELRLRKALWHAGLSSGVYDFAALGITLSSWTF